MTLLLKTVTENYTTIVEDSHCFPLRCYFLFSCYNRRHVVLFFLHIGNKTHALLHNTQTPKKKAARQRGGILSRILAKMQKSLDIKSL